MVCTSGPVCVTRDLHTLGLRHFYPFVVLFPGCNRCAVFLTALGRNKKGQRGGAGGPTWVACKQKEGSHKKRVTVLIDTTTRALRRIQERNKKTMVQKWRTIHRPREMNLQTIVK